jgi:hypothetical protein
MTNLTKPPNNMLMRTNSFMKPASQLQNRPLLRRSITGMGAFLLSNKHEFKKEDNKKNRNKNQSPNNYIISDQFDPSSSKKSKQNNNNNDYDEDEDLHKFDLYRSSPTLFYIKEKYKMYLEWLNEKSSKENHQQLMNSSTDITPQLNWYNYEKIVYLNETSCLDYLKYIQSSSNSSSSSSSSSPESITIESNIQRKESIPIPSINRMSSSSMSFNNKQLINKNKNKVRSISQQEMTCNNSKSSSVIPKQCSDTILITNLKSNTNNNTSLKNLLNKLSNNNNENSIFESSQKLTKEVKFDQSFSITNSTITNTTSNSNNNNNNNTNPISILKPILKTSSIMNNSTNEYYFNNNLKTISPREQLRRVSVLTINNNNNNNNNTTASKSLSNLKLPPILNASDDFQAVMNDLLSSNE